MPSNTKETPKSSNVTEQKSLNFIALAGAAMLVDNSDDATQRNGTSKLSPKGFAAMLDTVRSERGLARGATIADADFQAMKDAIADVSTRPLTQLVAKIKAGEAVLESHKTTAAVTETGYDWRESISTREGMSDDDQWNAAVAKNGTAKTLLVKAQAKAKVADKMRDGNDKTIAVHEAAKTVKTAVKRAEVAATQLQLIGGRLGKNTGN